jgi:hypothetical protein
VNGARRAELVARGTKRCRALVAQIARPASASCAAAGAVARTAVVTLPINAGWARRTFSTIIVGRALVAKCTDGSRVARTRAVARAAIHARALVAGGAGGTGGTKVAGSTLVTESAGRAHVASTGAVATAAIQARPKIAQRTHCAGRAIVVGCAPVTQVIGGALVAGACAVALAPIIAGAEVACGTRGTVGAIIVDCTLVAHRARCADIAGTGAVGSPSIKALSIVTAVIGTRHTISTIVPGSAPVTQVPGGALVAGTRAVTLAPIITGAEVACGTRGTVGAIIVDCTLVAHRARCADIAGTGAVGSSSIKALSIVTAVIGTRHTISTIVPGSAPVTQVIGGALFAGACAIAVAPVIAGAEVACGTHGAIGAIIVDCTLVA